MMVGVQPSEKEIKRLERAEDESGYAAAHLKRGYSSSAFEAGADAGESSSRREGNFIRHHPVFFAAVLVYMVVWIVALPQIASVPIPGLVVYIAGTLGPLWAAFVAETESRSESGIRD